MDANTTSAIVLCTLFVCIAFVCFVVMILHGDEAMAVVRHILGMASRDHEPKSRVRDGANGKVGEGVRDDEV